MRPDSAKLIWDACASANWIIDHISGRALEEYLGDEMLRLSTERQFITLGEALSQLSRKDPEITTGLDEIPEIVGFRNILVHGYAEIDDELVWKLASSELPQLVATLRRLLNG